MAFCNSYFSGLVSSKVTTVDVILTFMMCFSQVLSDCPEGWGEFSSSCYYFHAGSMSWDTSFTTCQNQEALIVEITSTEENTYVNSISNGQSIWLNCRDDVTEGEYLCGEDDHPVTYTAWGPLKPSGIPAFDCVYFLAGSWSDANCAIPKSVVCEKDNDLPVPTTEQSMSTVPVTTECPITTEGPITTNGAISTEKAGIDEEQIIASAYMQKDSTRPGYCLVGHVIKDIQSSSLIRCLDSCIRLPTCSSMNVNSHEGTCQLNNSTRTVSSSDFKRVDNCEYFEYFLS
ncbi:low affinity immunoglobulin epsilon Fc receptor-like [Lytechinus pictus]|uniref:low affinity immunoglobulin epsilon Fc receptor-like n=1 Tax=Lytechinus pictus TaxID=7653 RepID=UPI0030B9F18A